ncbi:MAG: CcmD family protein [Bacteroidetes bacterium]|nr:CcmD family protein [Bacteroidota bacterium]
MNAISLLTLSLLQSVAKPVVTMADQMRSDGRIYVVIAVMLTILLGITFYLVRLDKKISRLEKQS